jgi:hypothetical protein
MCEKCVLRFAKSGDSRGGRTPQHTLFAHRITFTSGHMGMCFFRKIVTNLLTLFDWRCVDDPMCEKCVLRFAKSGDSRGGQTPQHTLFAHRIIDTPPVDENKNARDKLCEDKPKSEKYIFRKKNFFNFVREKFVPDKNGRNGSYVRKVCVGFCEIR